MRKLILTAVLLMSFKSWAVPIYNPEVEALADQQKAWVKKPGILVNNEAPVEVYLTDRGTARLNEPAVSYQTDLEVSSEYHDSTWRKGTFEEVKCGGIVGVTNLSDTKVNKLLISGGIFPINNSALQMGVRFDNKEKTFAIENPATIEWVTARLEFSDDSFTRRDGGVDPRVINKKVQDQIDQQLSKINSSGELTLDLSGIDVLACDFITGRARIIIDANTTYEGALLWRDSVISPKEVEAIYKDLSAKPKLKANLDGRRIIGAAQLALSGEKNLKEGLEAYLPDHFIRLHGLFFDVAANLKSLNSFEAVSNAMAVHRIGKQRVTIQLVGFNKAGDQ